jgi:hypothetical protein
MKKIIIYLFILLCWSSCEENTEQNTDATEKTFYYAFDEKIELHKIAGKLLVKTTSSVTKSQYEQLVKNKLGEIKIEWQNDNLCKIELENTENTDEKISELLLDDEVLSTRNYYKLNSGLELGLSDEIIVRFNKNVEDSEKEKILGKFDLQKVKATKIYELYHISKYKDIIAAANELYESGLFEFAYPNLISKAESYNIPGSEKDLQNEDNDISIRMIETIDGAKRTLQFFCLTKEVYPCINYQISTTYNQTEDKINVTFGDVIRSEICLTAIGPAQSSIDLGTLNNGDYQLNINSSEGKLVVSDESYTITFSENEQFEIVNSPLMRIPANTIWGTVGYHEISTSALVRTFIDSLQQLGAVEQKYKQGHYGEYEIDEDGQIVQPGENSGYYFAESFIFHYSENISALENLVKYYGNKYGETLLYLYLQTDKGEIYRSWIH